MATANDVQLANQSGQSYRNEHNTINLALVSGFLSSSEPATTYAGMIWLDSSPGSWIAIKRRNSANNAWQYVGRADVTDVNAQFLPHESSPKAMTVALNAGKLLAPDASYVSKAAQTTGTITAPASDSRIDRVVIDGETGTVSVVTGTPAASPSAPAIPAGKLPICQVLLTSGHTEIADSDITDERVLMRGIDESPALRADGSVAATADLPMGGNRITGGADGTNATDFVTKQQLDSAKSEAGFYQVITEQAGDDVAGDTRVARLWRAPKAGSFTAYLVAGGALTSDLFDYATIGLYEASAGLEAQLITRPSGSPVPPYGPTGDWGSDDVFQFADASLGVPATVSVAAGDVIRLEVTKSGAGVKLPQFAVVIDFTPSS